MGILSDSFTHIFGHSIMRLCVVHLFIQLLIYSMTHYMANLNYARSFLVHRCTINLFIHFYLCSIEHSFAYDCSFIYSSTPTYVYSYICVFNPSLIQVFIPLFICAFIQRITLSLHEHLVAPSPAPGSEGQTLSPEGSTHRPQADLPSLELRPLFSALQIK